MEQKNDQELKARLRKGKAGKLSGNLIMLVGAILVVAGLVTGGNVPLLLIGVIVFGLGQFAKKKTKDSADQWVFETVAPELLKGVLEDVDFQPSEHLVDVRSSGIPLPDYTDVSGSGYIKGRYHGHPVELCRVKLTKTESFQREEDGMWEERENDVYTGQWLACETGQTLPAGLTIWKRGKLDKLFRSATIKTDNEAFNKQFNFSCDDEQAALRFLTPGRIERFLALKEQAFSDFAGNFAVSLHDDGKLYIAAHSGRGFFDTGKGCENPDALRQRFTRELAWFTDMVDLFAPM